MKKIKKFISFLTLIVFILINTSSSSLAAVLIRRVNLKVVGDIMVHDVQYNCAYNYNTGTYDFSFMFEQVKDYLKADLLIGNLETTFSGPKLGYSSYPRFNTPDSLAKTLKELGFDLLFTANNHCLDKGEKGLKRTIEILNKNNILHTGTFRSKEERKIPLIVKVNGISFGFLNYTYGTNGMLPPKGKNYMVNYINLNIIQKDIQNLKNKVDMIIVGLHFGTEYKRKPSEEEKKLVKEIFELGADIILGTHPHILQPYEILSNKERKGLVVYSLGNFVSGQKFRYTDSGAIMNLTIEKSVFDKFPKIVDISYTPIWVRRYYYNSRLKLNVVPLVEGFIPKVPFSREETVKVSEITEDVKSVWKPYERESNILLSYWGNKYFPVFQPHLWPLFLLN